MEKTTIATITVGDMRRELLAARERTGDKTLSHTVKQGRFQLCRVVYTKRSSVVTPLSDWQNAVAHLNTLQSYGV